MTNTSQSLLVSVVTPVYNGEEYLPECIESVLGQTYDAWEYVIVDNGSTDRSVEIAARYARRDRRIKLVRFTEHVDVISSYNRAFRQISVDSAYCKCLAADDCLFPECLSRMVEFAKGRPSVGVVGAYAIRGGGSSWRVVFDGLSYDTTIVPGREACRHHLLNQGPYYFGAPSSVLYRADLVRGREAFFPNSREHADVSAFYECLENADYGFIHEVLSYWRAHERALTTEAERLSSYEGSRLLDLKEYGPRYLTPDELDHRLTELLQRYYRLLAVGIVNFKDNRYWKYHRDVLRELGAPFHCIRLVRALSAKVLDLAGNPKQSIEKVVRRFHTRRFAPEKRGPSTQLTTTVTSHAK